MTNLHLNSKPAVAYIGLGSNLGVRESHIQDAIQEIGKFPEISVTRVSSLIETEPVGPIEQGPFLNAAVELHTTIRPKHLLELFHSIEASHGRDRQNEIKWGPRPLDIDLLLYDMNIIDEPGLKVPHPRMTERIFVLESLLEIAPDLVDPRTGNSIRKILEGLLCIQI